MISQEQRLQQFFKILGDKSKFRIIMHLTKGEVCVCVLSEELGLEQTLVSHHLQTLRDAGLIRDRKVGKWVHCSLNKEKFAEIEDLFQKKLSSKYISDKSCIIHDACR